MRYAREQWLGAFLLLAFMALAACSHQPRQASLQENGGEKGSLVSTEQFLPLRHREENGRLKPYEAAPNPYTEVKGQVERDAVATYIEARRAFRALDYPTAEALLEELVEKHPQLSGPWVMRGDMALDRGELAQAVDYFYEALRINPVNFNAYLRLAKAQRMQGRFIEAQNTYAEALSRWPDGAELHLNLGVLYDVYLNEPLKAQAHMEAYQVISGDNSGDVVAWLDEIRHRTGVDTALTVVGPDGEPESRVSGDDNANDSRDLAAREGSDE